MFSVFLMFWFTMAHVVFVSRTVDARVCCFFGLSVLGLIICRRSYFQDMVPAVLSLLLFWLPYCIVSSVLMEFCCSVFSFTPLPFSRVIDSDCVRSSLATSVARILTLSCCSNTQLAPAVYALNTIVIFPSVSCFAVSCGHISFRAFVGRIVSLLFLGFSLFACDFCIPYVSASLFGSRQWVILGLRCW